MDVTEFSALVDRLRHEGNDLTSVEVKRASSGFPVNIAPTLSAFANAPGGGTVIFGLDEKNEFEAVGVYHVAECQSALASCARQAVDPPITFDVESLDFEHAPIVVAHIHEGPSSAKPYRVRANGRAYLRAYDGDFKLSPAEEQAFIAHRDTPRFDQGQAPGAKPDDLDPNLVGAYVANCRLTSASLGRFTDEEILHRTGVTVGDERIPSVAGVLALGIHPQQFFPNAVIQASIATSDAEPSGVRTTDTKRFDGPIPLMLDEALRWVGRNSRIGVHLLRRTKVAKLVQPLDLDNRLLSV